MADNDLPQNVQQISKLLSQNSEVACNRIIGGWGFFRDNRQFAMYMNDRLFLHVDTSLRNELEALQSSPFEYSRQGRTITVTRYYSVPEGSLQDTAQILDWSERSFRSSASDHELQKNPEAQDAPPSRNALIICTSHSKLGDTGNDTGIWFEELVDACLEFSDAGFRVVTASPLGGVLPIDPSSNSDEFKPGNRDRFMQSPDADILLHHSVPLSDIQSVDEFDLIFIAGGHGAMWDLKENAEVTRLLSDCFEQDKPLGAVCHGVASLLNENPSTGKPFARKRKVTGFTNAEEDLIGLTSIVPFLLQDELEKARAGFSLTKPLRDHCVVDGMLVTGQNPFSLHSCIKSLIGLTATSEQKQMLSSGK